MGIVIDKSSASVHAFVPSQYVAQLFTSLNEPFQA